MRAIVYTRVSTDAQERDGTSHQLHPLAHARDAHALPRGATLPRVMFDAGIPFEVARVWPEGDKALERRLKNWNKPAALCPTCRAAQLFPLPLTEERLAA